MKNKRVMIVLGINVGVITAVVLLGYFAGWTTRSEYGDALLGIGIALFCVGYIGNLLNNRHPERWHANTAYKVQFRQLIEEKSRQNKKRMMMKRGQESSIMFWVAGSGVFLIVFGIAIQWVG